MAKPRVILGVISNTGQNSSAVEPSPDFEFEDPPRGRVEYIPKENQFVIYVDRCILVRKHFIRLIMAEMNLPPERTKTSSDEHYRCLHCPRD